MLLLATFALRAARAEQPIVENYVGRQVPTAMVARNLDRGSGFLRPRLDTGPFPNLFLVEPPIYALAVVGWKRATGLALEPSGRLVSALATALGAWGLFGLARRREGPVVAMLAVACFALLPITIRYGRAFQPDALMLGTLLAGLRCWDESADGGRAWSVAAWSLTAIGLALKVIAAPIFVALSVMVVGRPIQARNATGKPSLPAIALLLLSTLLPVACWYIHAASLLSTGSRASADNAALWWHALAPSSLARPDRLRLFAHFLFVRSFTPLGLALAAPTFLLRRLDRLWVAWLVAALASFLFLAGKLHHEYYWLLVAPPIAVGIARTLGYLLEWGGPARIAAVVLAAGFVGAGVAQSASTWRTPREWSALPAAARAIAGRVPRGALLVAPEAVLFSADRRGGRLEADRASAVRAAGEWGGTLADDGPLALLEFYRLRGTRFVADVFDEPDDARRPLHEAIRRRYEVLVDQPGFLLAALGPREAEHADRRPPRHVARLRPLEGRPAQDHRADRLRLHDGPPAR